MAPLPAPRPATALIESGTYPFGVIHQADGSRSTNPTVTGGILGPPLCYAF